MLENGSLLLGLLLGIFGIASMLVLSIMKIMGSVTVPWFAGLTTLSAVGTGLWLVFLAWIFFLITFVLYLRTNS